MYLFISFALVISCSDCFVSLSLTCGVTATFQGLSPTCGWTAMSGSEVSELHCDTSTNLCVVLHQNNVWLSQGVILSIQMVSFPDRPSPDGLGM